MENGKLFRTTLIESKKEAYYMYQTSCQSHGHCVKSRMGDPIDPLKCSCNSFFFEVSSFNPLLFQCTSLVKHSYAVNVEYV